MFLEKNLHKLNPLNLYLHDHTHHNDNHHHTHGVIDPTIVTSQKGLWAIKWSFVGLLITALLQAVVVLFSGSVALLADTIHNFGDAATAVPLWIAFILSQRKPSKRFTYGYGRVEDLAGLAIILTILLSAIVVSYEVVERFLHPRLVEHTWAVMAASVIGFLGNEAVAIFRIKVGKEISSAALIADGYHARVDGLTSLAVLFGALCVGLGYPLADPIVGLLIAVAIVRIVWQQSQEIFTRMLDGVEPEVIDEIKQAIYLVPGVQKVAEVRARWVGHQLYVEAGISVKPEISVVAGQAIANQVRHQLLHHLRYPSKVTLCIIPPTEFDDPYHCFEVHDHDKSQIYPPTDASHV